MAANMDERIERVNRQLRQLFADFELTPEETAFVNEGGKQLATEAFELFLRAKNMEQMRPFVIALAIAAILGPTEIWSDGIEALK